MTDEPTVDEYDLRVGSNVRRLRTAHGLTQTDLSTLFERYGLSVRQTAIVKIEKGQRALRLQEADALADAFDVEIEKIVGRKHYPEHEALLVEWVRTAMDAHFAARRALADLQLAQDELHQLLQEGHEFSDAQVRQAHERLSHTIVPDQPLHPEAEMPESPF